MISWIILIYSFWRVKFLQETDCQNIIFNTCYGLIAEPISRDRDFKIDDDDLLGTHAPPESLNCEQRMLHLGYSIPLCYHSPHLQFVERKKHGGKALGNNNFETKFKRQRQQKQLNFEQKM